MTIIEAAEFSAKLNQVGHKFEVYLDSSNAENTDNIFPINLNAIVNLTIEETLADWVTRGTMSLLYNPEINTQNIDKRTGNTKDTTTGITTSQDSKPFYKFRNDGYDRLRIRITPDTNTNLAKLLDTPQLDIKDDDEHWTLSYLFSIYDMEDIDLPPGAQNQASASIKCLKIYFWDMWYQRMMTNVLEFSTALSPDTSNIDEDKTNNTTYNYGRLNTGRAMKEIIDLSLSDSTTQKTYKSGSCDVAKIYGGPQKGTANIGDEWEEGKSKIFYTAPAQTTAYDSLMYLYDKHVSEVADNNAYDFCILSKDRGSTGKDLGYLTLKPISTYFKNAGSSQNAPGEYQFEHFFLQSYSRSDKTIGKYLGPMSLSKSDKIDLKAAKYNSITNYRFVDISSLTNALDFANTPVYSFDFQNRTFKAEFETNSVKTARSFMNKKYIDQVYKEGSGDKLFLVNLNKDKETNKVIRPVYSLYGDDPALRQSAGLQKLLYIGLFQNAAINFRTLGLTFRRPGSFIAIDKTEGVEDDDFQNKFYGQWFVINVKHVIETELYYNDITAVKIHRFKAPKTTFNQTY